MPRTPQCEAVALATTYTDTHRCLKTRGLLMVGGRRLCAHHRTAEESAR